MGELLSTPLPLSLIAEADILSSNDGRDRLRGRARSLTVVLLLNSPADHPEEDDGEDGYRRKFDDSVATH
jgi:hypothetical protein